LTTWKADTCDCILQFNNRINWISTIKKCRLHKSLDGQNLLDTVLAQNRRFNLSIINPTEEEQDEISISREVNKIRIRKENLDNFHEHLPEHHTRTFLENLKRILRGITP